MKYVISALCLSSVFLCMGPVNAASLENNTASLKGIAADWLKSTNELLKNISDQNKIDPALDFKSCSELIENSDKFEYNETEQTRLGLCKRVIAEVPDDIINWASKSSDSVVSVSEFQKFLDKEGFGKFIGTWTAAPTNPWQGV